MAHLVSVVVVLLVASVSLASADDGWVLWEQWVIIMQNSEAHGNWTVVEAYGGRDECERVQQERVSRDAEVQNAANAGNPYRNKQARWRIWYLCLPDTSDPREPKGR